MKSFQNSSEKVVLLHGLARTSRSMQKLADTLSKQGYQVLNLAYPSRKYGIEKLSELVRDKIEANSEKSQTIHVVTHSMGGILLRYIQKNFALPTLGRVVMLSPPNQGSEVVDVLGKFRFFKWVNGPASLQLGTSPHALVSTLGPVNFELGVLTGNRSINWILSRMIAGENDGKVSVEHAKVQGMKAFKVIPATHPFIMKKTKIFEEIVSFLKTGQFLTKPGCP